MSEMKPYNQFEVAPISGAFGPMVKGFDRSEELELSQVSEIEHAVNEFHVLFFRDQRLTVPDQNDFAGNFGKVAGP
tara:strand:- start:737 stop:964 length:228 start_codon:yes stop_codon:yes gene_type:complete